MKRPMITIYCIAMDGEGPTGVDWFWRQNVRDSKLGRTGAEIEVPFEIRVPSDFTYDQTTEAADDAAWNKTYLKEAA